VATIDRIKLQELAALPAGEAGRWIRKNIDPLWGISTGAVKDFTVTLEGHMSKREDFAGSVTVQATDAKHAEKLAFAILDDHDKHNQFNWKGGNPLHETWDDEDWEVKSVKAT
jgi:hypothetical protein